LLLFERASGNSSLMINPELLGFLLDDAWSWDGILEIGSSG
jgi:hypothetical protein